MQIILPSLGGSPVHFTHGEPITKANFFGLNDSQLHTVASASRYPSYCLHARQGSFLPVARWPGGQGGQLPPQLALKRGRQNDDRGAPTAKQITRNVFN